MFKIILAIFLYLKKKSVEIRLIFEKKKFSKKKQRIYPLPTHFTSDFYIHRLRWPWNFV